jgi:predicted nucleic acid-binding protein
VNKEAVVNASPLIFLSRGGHFDLLQLIAARIIVPDTVAAEISARGENDPTVRCLRSVSWLNIARTDSVPASILSWGLGAGESAVLALALFQPGRSALLDDLAGRRCAAALSIPVKGTLGIILHAKRKGLIAAARPVLEDLVRGGMYLSRPVLDSALALVDE